MLFTLKAFPRSATKNDIDMKLGQEIEVQPSSRQKSQMKSFATVVNGL